MPKLIDPKLKSLIDKYGFDLDGAEEEGYSHEEIQTYLQKKNFTQVKELELLLCPPYNMETTISNNRWMKELSPEEKEVNIDKATAQFHTMYSLLAQDAFVYLFPASDRGFQDEVYITNAGVTLAHLYKTAVLSKFKAEGRPGEEKELEWFLKKYGYETHQCPHYFEGEAELKWIKDNIYVGGYGIRSDLEAFNWMSKKFDMNIITVEETDPLTYHLDCSIFPLSNTKVIYNTDIVKGKTLKQLEAVAECIPVSKKDAQFSIANNLRIGSIVYTGSAIKDMKESDKEYPYEKHKNETLEKICRDAGLELIFINLSEFNKSGAALSCCIYHLNYTDFFD